MFDWVLNTPLCLSIITVKDILKNLTFFEFKNLKILNFSFIFYCFFVVIGIHL